jgi:hypothetical protein
MSTKKKFVIRRETSWIQEISPERYFINIFYSDGTKKNKQVEEEVYKQVEREQKKSKSDTEKNIIRCISCRKKLGYATKKTNDEFYCRKCYIN